MLCCLALLRHALCGALLYSDVLRFAALRRLVWSGEFGAVFCDVLCGVFCCAFCQSCGKWCGKWCVLGCTESVLYFTICVVKSSGVCAAMCSAVGFSVLLGVLRCILWPAVCTRRCACAAVKGGHDSRRGPDTGRMPDGQTRSGGGGGSPGSRRTETGIKTNKDRKATGESQEAFHERRSQGATARTMRPAVNRGQLACGSCVARRHAATGARTQASRIAMRLSARAERARPVRP